jgi:hypothetical protein
MSPRVSDVALREHQALCEAASPGRWFVVGLPWNQGEPYIMSGSDDPHVGRYVCELDSNSIADMEDENLDDDAAFIAAAREGWPATLADLADARAELAQRPIWCPDCGGHGWVAEPGQAPDLPNQVGCQRCGGFGMLPPLGGAA